MQPLKNWSKGYSTGMANSDAVLSAEGMPICRMVEPVVPNAIDLILAAPMMRNALVDLVQCILSGGDPTEKNEQGVSLLMQAQQAIPKV